jgi:hypothetical protein
MHAIWQHIWGVNGVSAKHVIQKFLQRELCAWCVVKIVHSKTKHMYIVIETFDPLFPSIVSDPETGMPLLFDTQEEAQEEADNCQEAIVVEI